MDIQPEIKLIQTDSIDLNTSNTAGIYEMKLKSSLFIRNLKFAKSRWSSKLVSFWL